MLYMIWPLILTLPLSFDHTGHILKLSQKPPKNEQKIVPKISYGKAGLDEGIEDCEAELQFESYKGACYTHKNEHYCVDLDVADRVDAAGNPISHIWDLGDGFSKIGSPVEHCFEKHGSYTVKLISTKKVGHRVFSDTSLYTIDIDEIVIIQEIKSDDPGQPLKYYFDGTNSFVHNDYHTENYYWDFGDGSFHCGALGIHQFEKPGAYEVKLLVEGRADTGGLKYACAKKILRVR